MATFTKQKLSGSTDGKAIKLTGNDSAGAVTVHTAVAGTTVGTFDEIWLYANNTSTSAVKLTVEWGTATAADGNIELTGFGYSWVDFAERDGGGGVCCYC
jgi:hypothetical protein